MTVKFQTYVSERTKGNYLNGMIAHYCRCHGLKRARGKFQFFKHTLGLGSVHVVINEDHVRLRVKELGLDRCFRDRQEFRYCLEDIDNAEANLAKEWLEVIHGNQSQITGVESRHE